MQSRAAVARPARSLLPRDRFSMRLWSVHPYYLDPQGLVALWREALLAQKVLAGGTRGYTKHPQLLRFQEQINPIASITAYLESVANEASRRGYQFDRTKLLERSGSALIPVTAGQLAYEWTHLHAKLAQRSPALAVAHQTVLKPALHPLFTLVEGPIANWERV